MTEFEKWYCGKFQGRKLGLTASSSTVVSQFTSSIGTYELELTMFQMTVLRAFVDCQKAKLSLEALQVATGNIVRNYFMFLHTPIKRDIQ